jgi:hypothetical protein
VGVNEGVIDGVSEAVGLGVGVQIAAATQSASGPSWLEMIKYPRAPPQRRMASKTPRIVTSIFWVVLRRFRADAGRSCGDRCATGEGEAGADTGVSPGASEVGGGCGVETASEAVGVGAAGSTRGEVADADGIATGASPAGGNVDAVGGCVLESFAESSGDELAGAVAFNNWRA